MQNDANTVEGQDETKQTQTDQSHADETTADDSEARIKKAEDEAAKWRRIAEKKDSKPDKINNDREIPKPSDILKADEFKLYRMGYNESEIDTIMHNGGLKIIQDEKHPLTMGLKVAREQRKAEEASTQATSSAGQSEIEKKYTEQDMRNMKPDELAKLIGYAS